MMLRPKVFLLPVAAGYSVKIQAQEPHQQELSLQCNKRNPNSQ